MSVFSPFGRYIAPDSCSSDTTATLVLPVAFEMYVGLNLDIELSTQYLQLYRTPSKNDCNDAGVELRAVAGVFIVREEPEEDEGLSVFGILLDLLCLATFPCPLR